MLVDGDVISGGRRDVVSEFLLAVWRQMVFVRASTKTTAEASREEQCVVVWVRQSDAPRLSVKQHSRL